MIVGFRVSKSHLKYVAIFAAAFLIVGAAFVLFRNSPNPQTRAAATWEALDDGIKIFNEFLSASAPSLGSSASLVQKAIQEHSREIEVITGFILSRNPNLSYNSALRIACALKHGSLKYGVPIDLVVSVAYTESRFAPRARSNYGAAGLMQVVWRVHNDLLTSYGIPYEHLLLEPEFGAVAGCILLSRYIADSENLVLALGRYYGGDGNTYWLRVSKAMGAYRYFKAIYGDGRHE